MLGEILKINSVDFSGYVNKKSYEVQQNTEYVEWVDGNHKTHRSVTRQKVSGKFTLTFLSITDYTTFRTNVAAATNAEGYVAVTLYVNNTQASATINAFLDITAKTVWTTDAYDRSPEVALVTVKLEER